MIEPQAAWISEPDGYLFQVDLQGAGAAAPTRLKGRNNYTVTRSGTGVIKLSFNDDPGPTYMGLTGFGFGDATATNVLGWTVCDGGFTARSGSTAAFVTFTIGNSSFAAADLLATSTLSLQFSFKQQSTGE